MTPAEEPRAEDCTCETTGGKATCVVHGPDYLRSSDRAVYCMVDSCDDPNCPVHGNPPIEDKPSDYEKGRLEGFKEGLAKRDEQIRTGTLPDGLSGAASTPMTGSAGGPAESDSPREGERVTLYRCPSQGWTDWCEYSDPGPRETVEEMDGIEKRTFVPEARLKRGDQQARRWQDRAEAAESLLAELVERGTISDSWLERTRAILKEAASIVRGKGTE